MKTSASGRAAIAQREGDKLKAYRDTKGIWTIGVGHTAMAGAPAPKAGMTITAAQSDEILSRDLANVEAAVNSAVKVPVSQNQFDAMVSLAFNIGNGGFKKSTVVKRLNAGDLAGAGEAFMLWNKPKEIIGRRKTEQRQFLTGPGKLSKFKPVLVQDVAAVYSNKPVQRVPDPVAQKPVKVTPLPETPIADKAVNLEPVAAPAQATNKEIIMTVQKRLKDLGYNPGGEDGILGPLTRGSILSFKNDNKMKPVDTIDDELLTALATAKPREMVPARANATVAEVAAKIPEARVHWWTRLSAGLLGGGVGGVGLLDQITPAVGYLTPVKEFIGDVPPGVWIGGVVLVCVALYLGSQYGATKAKEAFNAGDRR